MSRTGFPLLTALLLAGVGLADERGPVPRHLGSDAALDALVRKIDRHLEAFWTSNDVTPAPIADDAEFFRRLSLDVVGRIPTAAEARAFAESRDPDKRRKKIDELFARPGYVNHFATVLRQTWIPQVVENPQFAFFGPQFETWLRNRLRDNDPVDKVVRELLTVPTLFANRRQPQPIGVGPDSPFAFMRVNEFKPENVAAAATRLFMGVKIECAQCHNHPHAPYKREQFWEQAAFFAEVQPTVANLSDAKYKREIKIPESPAVVTAKFFDDRRDPNWAGTKSPREVFVDWLTAPANPYFARNMANRAWAHFLGTGLVDPIDEPADDNPPAIPEVLDELARAFTASGYDMKFLLRAVARSKAYQLTSRQTHASQADPRRFARVSVKALSGEQLFDSLGLATGYHDPTPEQDRPFAFTSRRDFIAKFGSVEKVTEKQTSILQALTLMNGRFVNDQTSLDRSQFLAGVVDAPFWDAGARVDVLFLATLSRKPTPAEREKFASYVDRGGANGDAKKAIADVFWALLNSSEFVLNH